MTDTPPFELGHIINVAGTMTGLGASIASPEIRAATSAIMGHFVNMHELQSRASETISRLTGAEAGFMTASASAGITLSVAGCMTGMDPGRVEALPRDPGPKSKVGVQLGHLCHYGAPISQTIELSGATVLPAGQSTLCTDQSLRAAMTEDVSAALYVVSHHVVHYGQVPLRRFIEIAHEASVPVIVDAASEYDLRRFLADGADLVIFSGHKFLGGPTSGIVAGRRDLVRAAYLQNTGIGRGMKIGKESIAGAIAALEAWETRDHEGIRHSEAAALDLWMNAFSGIDGVTPRLVADPTGNPLDRLEVLIDAEVLGADASGLATELSRQSPPIIVRNHEVELGYFQLDPCNLKLGDAETVAGAIRGLLIEPTKLAKILPDLNDARNGGIVSYLNWGTICT